MTTDVITMDRPTRLLARMQGAARRVAVWADIARVAWKFSADVVGVGKLTDAPFAPAVNFVAVRPIALYGPSSTNPEYRLERSSVTVDIECGVIEETTPLDECKAYRQGACRVVVIAYGDTKDLKRITDGA